LASRRVEVQGFVRRAQRLAFEAIASRVALFEKGRRLGGDLCQKLLQVAVIEQSPAPRVGRGCRVYQQFLKSLDVHYGCSVG